MPRASGPCVPAYRGACKDARPHAWWLYFQMTLDAQLCKEGGNVPLEILSTVPKRLSPLFASP